MLENRVNTAVSRWISVVLLQGDEARDVIDRLRRSRPSAAFELLKQWDHGDETVDEALVNGYVYDRIPAGRTDQVIVDSASPYALTYSLTFTYVSLLRRYWSDPDPGLVQERDASLRTRVRTPSTVTDARFGSPGLPASGPERTVAL